MRWHEAESIWVEVLVAGSRRGYHRPSAVDPKPKYTTNRYRGVQSNDGIKATLPSRSNNTSATGYFLSTAHFRASTLYN